MYICEVGDQSKCFFSKAIEAEGHLKNKNDGKQCNVMCIAFALTHSFSST